MQTGIYIRHNVRELGYSIPVRFMLCEQYSRLVKLLANS